MKRAWPGALGEGREAEQPHAQVESPEAHSGRNQYAVVFALYGPPNAATHSGASTAKKRAAANENAQRERRARLGEGATSGETGSSSRAGKRRAPTVSADEVADGRATRARAGKEPTVARQREAEGSSSGTIVSDAMHAMGGAERGAAGVGIIEQPRDEGAKGRKRGRARSEGVGVSEFATRAFAAYAQGGSVEDNVVMLRVSAERSAPNLGGIGRDDANVEEEAAEAQEQRHDDDETEREGRRRRRIDILQKNGRTIADERDRAKHVTAQSDDVTARAKLDEMRDLKGGRDDGGDGGEGGEGGWDRVGVG